MNNSNRGIGELPKTSALIIFYFGDERGKSYLGHQILCSQKVKRSEEKFVFPNFCQKGFGEKVRLSPTQFLSFK